MLYSNSDKLTQCPHCGGNGFTVREQAIQEVFIDIEPDGTIIRDGNSGTLIVENKAIDEIECETCSWVDQVSKYKNILEAFEEKED